MHLRDPYQVLGVLPSASIEEVRSAYRQAVLRCHPDTHPENREDAVRQFREATAAYRVILCRAPSPAHNVENMIDQRVYAPQDFAVMLDDCLRVSQADAWQGPNRPHRVDMPSRDENACFAGGVALSVVLALVVMSAIAAWGVRTVPTGGTLWALMIAGLGLYAAMLVGCVFVVRATRRIVYLVARRGFRRALPGAQRPLNLP